VVGTVNAHIKTLTGLVPLCNMRMSWKMTSVTFLSQSHMYINCQRMYKSASSRPHHKALFVPVPTKIPWRLIQTHLDVG
jgi:hypothetical protein